LVKQLDRDTAEIPCVEKQLLGWKSTFIFDLTIY